MGKMKAFATEIMEKFEEDFHVNKFESLAWQIECIVANPDFPEVVHLLSTEAKEKLFNSLLEYMD